VNFNFDDFLVTFTSIIFEAMPFLVIGAVVSGMLEELLPQQFFTRWLPRRRSWAIFVSSLMGLALPMCECGIVPVMRRLMRKGVPPSCAITYMLSAPVINVIVLSSTAMAFWMPEYTILNVPGLAMVLLRGGLAFCTAVTVGFIIESLLRRNVAIVKEHVTRARLVESDESRRLLEEDRAVDPEQANDNGGDGGGSAAVAAAPAPPRAAARSLLDRMTAVADIALGDFIDIAAFLVIGSVLAATVNTALNRETLDTLASSRSSSILGMMGLAMLLSLCSEADAFVAANFRGFVTAAKLSFLVLGPMLDIKLLIMYRWVFTGRAVRTIVVSLWVIIALLCQCVDLFEITWFQSAASPGG
jgi:uncharacterized membrane protein YraQ (UPF0718 family)